MDQKSHKSSHSNTNDDKEILKKILSEKESDAVVKDKMYKILHEASSADDISMDTDLIDECIKTINLIEGNEEPLSKERVKAMRQNIDRRYKEWQSIQQKNLSKK